MDNGVGAAQSKGSSTCSRRVYQGISDQFPAGLRVLVVDDDPICLMILEKMLRNCLYEVTTCSRAVIALSMLRERKDGFDLVISDVYMPDMDGFKLLEHIGLEMDLPVIMMSADDGKDVVMKGVTHGACDYLIKPVRIEAIKNIWQHVVRKKRNELKDMEQSVSVEDSDKQRKQLEDGDYASSANEGSWRYSKKRKDSRDEDDEGEEREDSSTLKKPRVVWTVELHQQFVAAVNQLGIDKAVPKKILELMNVLGLTRENVASHLQKYRSYLRRLSGAPQQQGGANTSFVGTTETAIGSTSSLDGLDLQQALAIPGQLPPHSIATIQAGLRRTSSITSMGISLPDQMNSFSSDAQVAYTSKIRYRTGQQLGNKQVNLLHGIPVTMEPKQLMDLYQPIQFFENMNLQGSNGMSGFLTFQTSPPTNSSSHADTVNGQQSSSPILQMAQQGHQIPVSQTQSKMQVDMLQQSKSKGISQNENVAKQYLELPSSIGQHILSNENLGGVSDRNATIMNGGRGTSPVNPQYVAVSQPSSINFPFCQDIELPGNGFAIASTNGLSSFTSTRIPEAMPAIGIFEGLENTTSLKVSTGLVPSYNNENHIKSEEWDLQNSNINNEVTQHVNSMTKNPDFSPILDHQGFSASQHSEQNKGTYFSGKRMVPLGTENECGNQESIAQCHTNLMVDNSYRVKAGGLGNFSGESMLFTQNIAQEDLINAILKQQQGVGLGDVEFDFDGYSVDSIPE